MANQAILCYAQTKATTLARRTQSERLQPPCLLFISYSTDLFDSHLDRLLTALATAISCIVVFFAGAWAPEAAPKAAFIGPPMRSPLRQHEQLMRRQQRRRGTILQRQPARKTRNIMFPSFMTTLLHPRISEVRPKLVALLHLVLSCA